MNKTKNKTPKPPRLTLADLKFQIDYLAKNIEAHNQRLIALEVFMRDYQGMTGVDLPKSPEGS